MDHDQAVRQKATERYLLNELDPGLRDEFEEHLFDCQECALDVRAAAMFVEQSKVVLAEPPAPAPVRVPFPVPAKVGWMGWLRPAFAVPVLALLLVIGYQNLVTLPRMTRAMGTPQLLPSVMVNVSTRGSEVQEIAVPKGKGFLLYVRIPPQDGYSRYTADLYNPAEKLEWSLAIPATPGKDVWPVQVPAADRESGKYTLKVQGITASGQSTQVGYPTSFELQTQK
ncbi:MAG: zf-HC2 domain-containing protein [Acidobacteriia bacterium]|nr:zf-HC2 domain-containing protein [Terriglobia bacterium]